jgi:biopolymer transport protein ExbB/TolQ
VIKCFSWTHFFKQTTIEKYFRMGDQKTTSSQLSWELTDIEQRLGLRGGRFTSTNGILTFAIAAALTVVFYLILGNIPANLLADMLLYRGPIPYFIVFFSFWSLAILFVKNRKLYLQRKTLPMRITPDDHSFVLTSATVDIVRERIFLLVDDPRHFLLFNRIMTALASLKNLGQIADIENILRSQADRDESSVHTSYATIMGFVWAIPVLGFIGTVLGLSVAIGGFGSVLESASEPAQIVDALKVVTAGLGTAFETTLEGLVAALCIQLLITRQKRKEEEFLDECSEYCTRNIVGKLRFLPYEVKG